jgi:carbon storage regulator
MLVLTRKAGEQIMIGEDVVLTVLRVEGTRVQIGVTAPRGLRIERQQIISGDADQRRSPQEVHRAEVQEHPRPPRCAP